ncbi:MAG: Ldh family oxidoreductase [Bryobacteraceae bacterium]|nr:Ldh family oxidoreductase [Bryobacteraceae bacterium]
MPLIPHEQLRSLAERILLAAGVAAEHAALVATTLVATNLRGTDSHGIQLLSFYIDQLLAGDMLAAATGEIVSEDGTSMVYDAGNGLGQVTAQICAGHAARLAKLHGVGVVSARNANHFGAAFWWTRQMAEAGNVGIVMCDASPLVAPWQAREPRFGTNPICFALPGEESFLLDMATTTVAAGRIFKASINEQKSIPAGWALDAEGVPTTDTATAMQGLLMPLGGYKGSGLAMMVEILCGVLSGGKVSTEIGSIRKRGRPSSLNHFFLAIDLARFGDPAQLGARAAELAAMVRAAAPAKGYDEVLVAGDVERRVEAERRREGIPLPDGNWETLLATAKRVGVTI